MRLAWGWVGRIPHANSLKVSSLIHEYLTLSKILPHVPAMLYSFPGICTTKQNISKSFRALWKAFGCSAAVWMFIISKVSDLLVLPCRFFVWTTKQIGARPNISSLYNQGKAQEMGPLLHSNLDWSTNKQICVCVCQHCTVYLSKKISSYINTIHERKKERTNKNKTTKN